MRSPRLFLDRPLEPGSDIELQDEALHYARSVLRLEVGAGLRVFNGDGRELAATVSAVERRAQQVRLESEIDGSTESPLVVHLGIGLSRGERMDWVIQKATEMGVAAITPLQLERCNVRLDRERGENRVRHWQQIAISACEQCGRRRRLPVIAAPQPLGVWLGRRGDAAGLVLHTSESHPLPEQPISTCVFLLVGPEGGLSSAEFAASIDSGFAAWSLGPRILRTETAPVAALAILQFQWGDLR